MKLHLLGLLYATLLLSACGQSEEEKFYEKMNKDMEISKIQQKGCNTTTFSQTFFIIYILTKIYYS